MNKHRFTSLFDIIGPVMVGPSSSHTAGAVKIGLLARDIFKEKPTEVICYLYESFAETYKGHATDVALAAGILGYEPADKRLPYALTNAIKEDIKIMFIPLDDKADHPNTVKIIMKNDNKKMSVTGSSIGGGEALINAINNDLVTIKFGVLTIIIQHNDKPGVISDVSRILSEENINIATMEVTREQRGEAAKMIITIDHSPSDNTMKELLKLDSIDSAYIVGDNYE